MARRPRVITRRGKYIQAPTRPVSSAAVQVISREIRRITPLRRDKVIEPPWTQVQAPVTTFAAPVIDQPRRARFPLRRSELIQPYFQAPAAVVTAYPPAIISQPDRRYPVYKRDRLVEPPWSTGVETIYFGEVLRQARSHSVRTGWERTRYHRLVEPFWATGVMTRYPGEVHHKARFTIRVTRFGRVLTTYAQPQVAQPQIVPMVVSRSRVRPLPTRRGKLIESRKVQVAPSVMLARRPAFRLTRKGDLIQPPWTVVVVTPATFVPQVPTHRLAYRPPRRGLLVQPPWVASGPAPPSVWVPGVLPRRLLRATRRPRGAILWAPTPPSAPQRIPRPRQALLKPRRGKLIEAVPRIVLVTQAWAPEVLSPTRAKPVTRRGRLVEFPRQSQPPVSAYTEVIRPAFKVQMRTRRGKLLWTPDRSVKTIWRPPVISPVRRKFPKPRPGRMTWFLPQATFIAIPLIFSAQGIESDFEVILVGAQLEGGTLDLAIVADLLEAEEL